MELSKKELRDIEKKLMTKYKNDMKPITKEEVKKLQEKIDKFLIKKQTGLILFTTINKDMKPVTEYACLRVNKRMLREALELYIQEIPPIREALESIEERKKSKEFKSMVR